MADEIEEHSEGRVARAIETQTAKLPSDTFLWAALGAMGAAVFFTMTDRKHLGLLVGQWGPALLMFGLYDKLVKVAGSDRASTGERGRAGAADRQHDGREARV